MNIQELVGEAHEQAKKSGWHDGEPRHPLVFHMLMVSELAEASEQVRINAPDFWLSELGKPEGELAELADVIIRIADYAGSRGWDLDRAIREKLDYNRTRSYRHGNKSC